MNNNTNHDEMSCALNSGEIAIITGYCLIFIVGTLGNSIVLAVLWKFWAHGPILELLILYLAVFDLLSSILGPLLFSYWIFTCDKWTFGLVACKILPPLVRILSNLSLAFLIIMALDRYRAICAPFKERFSRECVHKIAFVTVCLCIAWEIPYFYFIDLETDECFPYYWKHFDSLPETVLLLVRDLGFVSIMLFTTIASYISLLQTDRRHHLSTRCAPIINMLLIMTIVSFVTILPRDLFRLTHDLAHYLNIGFEVNKTGSMINSMLKLLHMSNSIWNVFIYAGKHNHFWCDVRHLFSCNNNSNNNNNHRFNQELPAGITLVNQHPVISTPALRTEQTQA